MVSQNSVGFAIKGLDHLIHRKINLFARRYGLDDVTITHSFILHFLRANEDHDVFQRDLESNFHITRSAVTNIVQFLERSGYIRREAVPEDARLKKIVLTEQGIELDNKMKYSILETEHYIDSALSAKEREQFLLYCQKIRLKLEDFTDNKEVKLC
jgi:DNA-binding MarR family transcriptional regulator